MPYTFVSLQSEYASLWADMTADDRRAGEFLAVARRMIAGMSAYRAVEEITGVPASLIAVIHQREAGGNFATHLHNGDPLNARTVHVPAGRPARGAPPFAWEDSAIDALRYEGLDKLDPAEWSVERACYVLEGYNGFGYRNRGLRSPYLWGGSSLQQAGKYVADGKFDPAATDRQLGCMPLLAKLWSLDPSLRLVAGASGARRPAPPSAHPPEKGPPHAAPRPPPAPPESPGPALQGLLAALIAALVGGVVAFREAIADFFHHLGGGG